MIVIYILCSVVSALALFVLGVVLGRHIEKQAIINTKNKMLEMSTVDLDAETVDYIENNFWNFL